MFRCRMRIHLLDLYIKLSLLCAKNEDIGENSGQIYRNLNQSKLIKLQKSIHRRQVVRIKFQLVSKPEDWGTLHHTNNTPVCIAFSANFTRILLIGGVNYEIFVVRLLLLPTRHIIPDTLTLYSGLSYNYYM